MNQFEHAEMIALQAIEFMGHSPEQLERLMVATGSTPAVWRNR
jgi:hypothetical protein